MLATLPELMEMLHRILFAWRKHVLEGHNDDDRKKSDMDSLAPLDKSIELLDIMEELYKTTNNQQVLAGSKSFSLVLSTMSHFPDKLSFGRCRFTAFGRRIGGTVTIHFGWQRQWSRCHFGGR